MNNTRIGNFTLLRPLGGGASGDVFLAEETMTGGIRRNVALKILPLIRETDTEASQRFLSEAEKLIALGSTGSPYIVQCYSCGIDDGKPWISMQVVERSLQECFGEDPADPELVTAMIRDTASGLKLMHEQKLLHNDLKPANVLVDERNVYKLADFGLSAHLAQNHTLKLLTVRYAAPEMHSDSLGPPTFATDIYSIGHIAYEMALGRALVRQQFSRIYSDDISEQVALTRWYAWHTAMNIEAAPIATLLPSFPARLSDLISRMMKKKPSDRPANADQILAALAGNASPPVRPAEAPPEQAIASVRSSAPPKQSTWQKNRTLLVVVGVLLVLTLLAVILPSLFAKPLLALDDAGLFTTRTAAATVSGTIENKPDDAKLVLALDGQSQDDPTLDARGNALAFEFRARLSQLGEQSGRVQLTRNGQVLVSAPVRLRRDPPSEVKLRIRTVPQVADARVMIRPTSAPSAEVRTGPTGEADFSIPYGSFALTVEHPRYEQPPSADPLNTTGIESQRVVELPLRTKMLELHLELQPPTMAFELRSPDGKILPVKLDANGATTMEVAPGTFHVKASIEGSPPFERDLEVKHGIKNELTVRLSQPTNAINFAALQKGTGWADLDALKLAQMKDDAFFEYLKTNAPLATLQFRAPPAGMKQIRIEGYVLSDRELQRLSDRLLPARDRVDITGVEANANAVARQLADELRNAGLKSVQVLPQRGNANVLLQINYDQTPGFDENRIGQMSSRYILDRNLLDIRRPF